MDINTLSELFQRDLGQLAREISQYKTESDLWEVRGQISNSAGNLCLHLVGNLNHFIGAVLGQTGYVRDRPREFSDKDVPRENLQLVVDETRKVVAATLEKLAPEDLNKDYPLEMFGNVQKTGFMLLHLYGHLNYHLGQINYHRRRVS